MIKVVKFLIPFLSKPDNKEQLKEQLEEDVKIMEDKILLLRRRLKRNTNALNLTKDERDIFENIADDLEKASYLRGYTECQIKLMMK